MPQMKVENRYCSELRKKNDALDENCVTFEIRDESSPESSPPLNGFLQNGQLIKNDQSQNSRNGRNCEDKTLSGLSKNRDPLLNDIGPYPSNVVNGGNPTKVVNGHCSNGGNLSANKGDLKGSLFPDTLLSSVACKPNKSDMKVKKGCDAQDLGDFTDLLSFIHDQESKGHYKGKPANVKAFNGHVDNELQKSAFATRNDDNLPSILTSISFAKHDAPQPNSCLNFTKQNSPEINNGGLSDILSSISFDDIDTSQKNYKSSLNSSSGIKDYDSNELFSDFSFLNSHRNAPSNSTPPALQNNGSLSDMLSCIDFHENHKAKLEPKSLTDEKLVNDLKELSTELLNTKDCTDKDKCFSFPTNFNDKPNGTSEYNIDELLQSSSAVDTPETTKNNAKDDYSFFSVSPDNVFPSILSDLHTNSNQRAKNSNENTDNLSMLDLLKSVNTDSSSSFSGYLGSNETDPVKKSVSEDLSELLDIDLSGCIKSSENTDNIHQDLPLNSTGFESGSTTDVKLEDYIKPVFEENDANRPKINKSQSLFAKALSCKPKRNLELLQKASFVKSELYKLYFNRELLEKEELDKDFKLKKDVYTNTEMVVCKTNTCMVNFKGRRFCPSEVN